MKRLILLTFLLLTFIESKASDSAWVPFYVSDSTDSVRIYLKVDGIITDSLIKEGIYTFDTTYTYTEGSRFELVYLIYYIGRGHPISWLYSRNDDLASSRFADIAESTYVYCTTGTREDVFHATVTGITSALDSLSYRLGAAVGLSIHWHYHDDVDTAWIIKGDDTLYRKIRYHIGLDPGDLPDTANFEEH